MDSLNMSAQAAVQKTSVVPSAMHCVYFVLAGSDLDSLNMSAQAAVQKTSAVPRSVPPHLLMTSILEQICHSYVRDTAKAEQLFRGVLVRVSLKSSFVVHAGETVKAGVAVKAVKAGVLCFTRVRFGLAEHVGTAGFFCWFYVMVSLFVWFSSVMLVSHDRNGMMNNNVTA